jgi:hypothetical protein
MLADDIVALATMFVVASTSVVTCETKPAATEWEVLVVNM